MVFVVIARALAPVGSDGSAACGGVSDLSEWQRSANAQTLVVAGIAGYRNRDISR